MSINLLLFLFFYEIILEMKKGGFFYMIFVLQSEGKLFIMKGGVITGKKEDWHDQHCDCRR